MSYRPIGITILSIFIMVIGVIILVAGIVLLFGSAFIVSSMVSVDIARNLSKIPGMPLPMHLLVPAELLLVSIGMFATIFGIVTVLTGWGLWTGVNWARWIAIVFFGLSSLSNSSTYYEDKSGQ
jgi:hypothetical protein